MAERFDGRAVGDAVDPGGAEMPLEGRHHDLRLPAVVAGDLDAIAIEGQHRLQRLDGVARITLLQELPAAQPVRRHPMAEPLLMEPLPVEFLARVPLAAR